MFFVSPHGCHNCCDRLYTHTIPHGRRRSESSDLPKVIVAPPRIQRSAVFVSMLVIPLARLEMWFFCSTTLMTFTHGQHDRTFTKLAFPFGHIPHIPLAKTGSSSPQQFRKSVGCLFSVGTPVFEELDRSPKAMSPEKKNTGLSTRRRNSSLSFPKRSCFRYCS